MSSANKVSTGPTCQFLYVCVCVCMFSGLFFEASDWVIYLLPVVVLIELGVLSLSIATLRLFSLAEQQSWKKGCSTAAMLPEGNGHDHFWQKDFGQLYNICHIFD